MVAERSVNLYKFYGNIKRKKIRIANVDMSSDK